MLKRVFGLLFMFLGSIGVVAQEEADLQQVFFRVGSSSLSAKAVPQSMVDSVEMIIARGEKYTVLGVASPEGSQKANERLAKRRAHAIVQQLSKLTGAPDSMFNVKTKVADVNMVRDLASQDDNLPEKGKVMEILEAHESINATLAKLKKLGDGTPYLYIKDRLFPYLRASVASEKDLHDFHPDMMSKQQPQIVLRNYQAEKSRVTNQTAPNRQNAVTASSESRHSSSNNEKDSPNSISDSVRKDSMKLDSVKLNEPSEEQQIAQINTDGKILSSEHNGSHSVSMWIWVIILMLVLALLALGYYHFRKVAQLGDELDEAKSELAQKNCQLRDTEKQLEEAQKMVATMKEEQTNLYKDGEALFNHLLIGGITYEWTNEQIRTLIEYYKLQNYPLIHRLETEYDNLPLNHILFEILVNMGKSDQEIQRMMNVSQTTIRSYRFRIKNKKL